MPWTEKDRFLNLQTKLGDDKFLLREFSGNEGISQLFHFHLDLLSEDPAIDFDQMVGQNVSFSVRLADTGKARYFNGYVSRFQQLPGEERLTRYEAEIVPWLWFLTRAADCRIFQNQTVPDIIEKIFKDLGFTDYQLQLRGSYDPWEYCVQYRETSFNFVSRLMEEEGIFYFFKHENGKHSMIIADSPSALQPCPDQPRAMLERTTGQGALREEDVVYSWRYENALRSGKFSYMDYNFETPGTKLQSETQSQINQGGNQRFEIYDYPGEYETRPQGENLVKLRIEHEEAEHAVVSGHSDVRAFVSGYKFDLYGHDRRDQNDTYVLTSLTHHAEEGGFYSGAGSVSDSTYSNTFTCIKASTPFRPPCVAPKPLIHSIQTAVVVGPSGEEIYCDKYGRVKVQFHWDRVGTNNEKSSCWIRVAWPWAGNKWGFISLPRIGQEVVVSFLEGDPDRPLITGGVYNEAQWVPYPLPDKQVMSTFRSSSSKGGGNSNEMRYDDTKSKEQIYVHAAYDYDMLVDHDRKETIVGNSHHLIKGNHFERSKMDRHVYVDQNLNQKVGSTHSLNIGTNKQEKVGQNWAMDAGTEIHLKAGMNLVIESGTTLTLKVGGNFININSGGIFIKGSMVMINSGGAAGSGAGSSPTAPEDPKEVSPGAPTQSAPPPPPPRPPKPTTYSAAASMLTQAAARGAALCQVCPYCQRSQ
ncbi:MAG: type VI secretion system tip protein VgrG [Bryobacteraceae bacterium]|jgi:type VI secretion system secreted protein VgrG